MCLQDMFAAHALCRGDATAVVHGDRSITYGDLRLRSQQLAACLHSHGVGPDTVVGLHVRRSVDTIVAMLGILEGGGAYLPLSTSEAPERLSFILQDSGVDVVVSSSATAAALEGFSGSVLCVDALPRCDPPRSSGPRPTPQHLAYVIYTSGTTGTPKGVAVPHRAASRIVRSGIYGDFGPDQTFLQACPLSFDASVFEIWACLANGGRLVLLPAERASAESIVESVRLFGVTTLWLTPSVFNQIVDEGLLAECGRCQVVVGGEVLSTAHLARAMHSTPASFSNGYGPTEAGVFTCCHRFGEADLEFSPPPVGRPLPETQVWILDGELRPLPPGEPGELCIGGDALARGYHGRPELTAEAFVPSPFASQPGARMYRSGDLARALPGGLFQVLGRCDGQVKIRGNRVELAEVEAALIAEPDVRQAAAVDRLHGSERVLVAYIVPEAGQPPTVSGLRGRLARRLPDYMIPSEYFRLARLPLSDHAKVDRAALRTDEGAVRLELGTDFAPATSELEALIAQVWSEVLDAPEVGLDDNYFDVGGTSLSIRDVQGRLEHVLGIRLGATALYEYPTIRQLALALGDPGQMSR
jgi:amino acid adenylation domain-containing protein